MAWSVEKVVGVIIIIATALVVVAVLIMPTPGWAKELLQNLGLRDMNCDKTSFYLCRGKPINTSLGESTVCKLKEDGENYPIGKCMTFTDKNKCTLRCFNKEGKEGEASKAQMCEQVQDRGIFKWTFSPELCYETGFCFVHKGLGLDECISCKLNDLTGGAKCEDLTAVQHQVRAENQNDITRAQCTVCNDEFLEMDKPACYFDEQTGECKGGSGAG
jgi:hypothetical protein